MSDEHLFDPGPGTTADLSGLSPDARRTARNNGLLDSGTHPATGRPLLDRAGVTCGTCTHHVSHSRNKTWHKCDLTPGGPTRGAGTDIRVSWPACVLYESEAR